MSKYAAAAGIDGAAAPKLVWSRADRFKSTAFEDIAPSPGALSYLIKGVLARRGIAFMVGTSGAGKTFVALDWAIKVACGAKVMGRKTRQVGVVYVAAEDPDGVDLRIHAFKRKNPRSSYTPFRAIKHPVNLLLDEDVEDLIAEIRDIEAIFREDGFDLGLIVFDTFSACLPGGEENTSKDGSLALGNMGRIGREFGSLVTGIAHHGKDAAKGMRGWSGFHAGADNVITLEKDETTKDRTITLTKVKNGIDGERIGFMLDRQPLGLFDDDNEEAWSCIVRYDEAAPRNAKTRRRALSNEAEVLLRALGRLSDNGPHQDPPVSAQGVRPGTRAVRRDDLRLEAMGDGMQYPGESAKTFNTRFGRKLNELSANQRIRMLGDAIWLI